MLVRDVKVGHHVEIEDRATGFIGTLRIDDKSGKMVRLAFDVPRSVVVRVLDHRPLTFGIGNRLSA